ncbi:hypothetical protein [Saccharibacillus qingshengii]|uniref:hypothetical protein n=1 Tax=Saccharibacillus qingshengii TaxID=1763540 RepID=UPI0015548B71|nr:hypothetical protein [Saccharibacillus qingshengii]
MPIDLRKNPGDTLLMRAAAQGEPAALDELERRGVIFAQRSGVCLAVSWNADKQRQQGVLSIHPDKGIGLDSLIEIPVSFHIKSIVMRGNEIILSAADGRIWTAPSEQFRRRRPIREANNADYEIQLEEDFLELPTRQKRTMEVYTGDSSGDWSYEEAGGVYALKVRDLSVPREEAPRILCRSENIEELQEMLPAVKRRLGRLDEYLRAAAEYLWRAGSEAEREAFELDAFCLGVRLDLVIFDYYGDLELWLAEDGEERFPDWDPIVYFDRDDRIVG